MVNYGSDTTRLDLKLMAGDTDFDLFEPLYLYQHKYFLSGYYEDLSKYDGLKQKLDADLAANLVSKLGDTNESYLNLDSDENVYVYWHSFAWDYIEPIYTATNTVSQSDGKSGTIKKIAADAAYQVRMRLQG